MQLASVSWSYYVEELQKTIRKVDSYLVFLTMKW